MNIVIGSAFRDMSRAVNRYLAQVMALKQHVGEDHNVRVIAVEGDSVDHTDEVLAARAELWEIDIDIRKSEHGHPHFGSTESPTRLKELTKVSNAIFAGLKKDDDVLLYVESDLLWRPHDVGSLIDMAMRQDGGFDVFAPLVFAGEAFYDIWGFRGLDKERFGPFAPYHNSLPAGGLAEISSAGSCLAMRSEVGRKVKNTSAEGLVGWCACARKAKYTIACAVDFRVDHP